jgi:hypothetical protein
MKDIIYNINKLAIPFFDTFNDVTKLKEKIEENNIKYYFFDIDEMINFYIYITKNEIKEKEIIKNKLLIK